MENKEVFYCPTDEDSFEDLEDAMEFIKDVATNKDDAIGWVIEVHENLKPSHNSFIDGSSIIESFANSAHDEFGEYSESYLEDVFINDEKCKELENLISDWMDKNAEQPKFYQSKGQVGVIIVDQDLLDKYEIVIED
jgi:hypothetical protein